MDFWQSARQFHLRCCENERLRRPEYQLPVGIAALCPRAGQVCWTLRLFKRRRLRRAQIKVRRKYLQFMSLCLTMEAFSNSKKPLVRHLLFAQPLGRPAWLAMGEVATGSDRLFLGQRGFRGFLVGSGTRVFFRCEGEPGMCFLSKKIRTQNIFPIC